MWFGRIRKYFISDVISIMIIVNGILIIKFLK